MRYSRRTQQAVDAARDLFRLADVEGRDLSFAERDSVQKALDKADLERRAYQFDHGIGTGGPGLVAGDGGIRTAGQRPGDAFVASHEYRAIKDPSTRPTKWSSGPIEVKAELTEAVSPIVQPGLVPGIQETIYQPLSIADLFGQATTESNTVRYIQEVGGSVTNAADSVAEGGTKPESTLVFNEADEPVRKVATFLPVSDEFLEDVPAIQTYLNTRLGLFVRIAEEEQLVAGNGTAPNLSGLLDRGLNTWARGTVDNNATALFKAANGARGSSFLEPDAIVMNPANWEKIRLGTDSAGQYYGGGPFLGPYGGPQGPASASQFSADRIWNLAVHVTTAVGAGTAIVGAFRTGASLYRKGALTIEASNSHSDFFQRDMSAIRAETRLALAVLRPESFCVVTGLRCHRKW